jgi:hypothetical protein
MLPRTPTFMAVRDAGGAMPRRRPERRRTALNETKTENDVPRQSTLKLGHTPRLISVPVDQPARHHNSLAVEDSMTPTR